MADVVRGEMVGVSARLRAALSSHDAVLLMVWEMEQAAFAAPYFHVVAAAMGLRSVQRREVIWQCVERGLLRVDKSRGLTGHKRVSVTLRGWKRLEQLGIVADGF